MRLLGYFAGCLVAVVVAQIGAVILTVIVGFANITRIVAAIVGDDTAASVLGAVGNLIFASIFGAIVYSSLEWFRPRLDRGALTIAGVTAAVLGFVFPAFSAGFVLILADPAPELVRPLADPTVALIVAFAAYALVGGLVALVLGVAIDATRPSSPAAQ